MKRLLIARAQEFLTVNYDDRTYQMVNIELLMRRHPPEEVIGFLKDLRRDYSRQLKGLLRRDRTSPRINEMAARLFRLKMAINTIRNGTRTPQEKIRAEGHGTQGGVT